VALKRYSTDTMTAQKMGPKQFFEALGRSDYEKKSTTKFEGMQVLKKPSELIRKLEGKHIKRTQ